MCLWCDSRARYRLFILCSVAVIFVDRGWNVNEKAQFLTLSGRRIRRFSQRAAHSIHYILSSLSLCLLLFSFVVYSRCSAVLVVLRLVVCPRRCKGYDSSYSFCGRLSSGRGKCVCVLHRILSLTLFVLLQMRWSTWHKIRYRIVLLAARWWVSNKIHLSRTTTCFR